MILGPSDFTTAAELAKQKGPQRFSTGSRSIDEMRAIETGAVTHVYGEPGSGSRCFVILLV